MYLRKGPGGRGGALSGPRIRVFIELNILTRWPTLRSSRRSSGDIIVVISEGYIEFIQAEVVVSTRTVANALAMAGMVLGKRSVNEIRWLPLPWSNKLLYMLHEPWSIRPKMGRPNEYMNATPTRHARSLGASGSVAPNVPEGASMSARAQTTMRKAYTAMNKSGSTGRRPGG